MRLPGRDVLKVLAGILIPGALLYFLLAQIVAYYAGSFAVLEKLLVPVSPVAVIGLFGAIVLLGYFWAMIAGLYEALVLDAWQKRNWHKDCRSAHPSVPGKHCFMEQWKDYTVNISRYKNDYVGHLADHFEMELRVGLALSIVGVESGLFLYLCRENLRNHVPLTLEACMAFAVASGVIGVLLLWPGAFSLHRALASYRRSMLEEDADSRFFAESEYLGAAWEGLIRDVGNLKSQGSALAIDLANILERDHRKGVRKSIADALVTIENRDPSIIQILKKAVADEPDDKAKAALNAALAKLRETGK